LTGKELSDTFISLYEDTYLPEVITLAGHSSAAKRHRQSERRRIGNKVIKSKVRNEIRRFLEAVDEKDAAKAENNLKTVSSLIDSAARKGIYHKNTAARTKSRLHKKYNALTAAS
jgi:small subunit ribosomal protein S20